MAPTKKNYTFCTELTILKKLPRHCELATCHGTDLTRCYGYAYALHGLGVAMTEHRPDP